MQFQVDKDTGDLITGWVLLDDPDAIAKVRVSAPNTATVELDARAPRPALKNRGLHNTGTVGFRIDPRAFPGLTRAKDLEIRNVETDVLIYRRRQDYHITGKLFRYEFQAMPQTQLDMLFMKHFALNYNAVERHTFDTLQSIVGNKASNSIYVAGRLMFNRYHRVLVDRGFRIVTALRDPYEELAERLLFLRYAASADRPAYLADYLTGFESLLKIAQQFDIANDNTLRKTFENLDDTQRAALSNPFVRSLACDLDELPEKRHIETALYNLSTFDLVGLYNRFDEFRSMMNDLMQVDILGTHQPAGVSWAPMIGAKLAQIEQVNEMLALDVELYSCVREAIEGALGRP